MEEKIRTFSEVPVFTDKQIEAQAEKQIRFLKAVYPFLEDAENWNEGCIELRPIRRDACIKGYVRSYNAWHLQEKDTEALKKFLGILNGKGYCLYFSSFSFDFHKEVIKENGKKFEKGKINNDNALYTCILPMDFDNITAEEFQKEKQKLLDLGIETIDIFTGHGYQSFILLESRVLDKEILKKFTRLLISKGFKVDEALQDPARVLRMPYSFNCKALDKKSKHYNASSPEIVATTDIAWTERRYHVADIFERIGSLPDVIPQLGHTQVAESDLKISTAPVTKAEKNKVVTEIKEVGQIQVQTLKSVYKMLNFEQLPEAIQKMLAGSQAGMRNMTMLFLIPFLRNSLGLNIKTIKTVMILWGERCSPSLNANDVHKEVERIYGLGFKGKFGKYTEKLRQAYGYLEFDKYTKRNKIIIPNGFFDDMSTMSDGAVRIFMAMKFAECLDGVKTFGKVDIQKYAQVSERTMERNMKELVSKGHVSKRRGNRRDGEGHVYYSNPYFNTVAGFTMLDNALVKLMLNDLTDGEIKLYSFLSKIVGDSGSECWTSQKYLATKIRKTQQGISIITNRLAGKGYIEKKTEEKNGIRQSSYTLKY